MQKRVFGKTGMEVTVLGFGGAEIGYENASLETVTELLNSALDAGLNVIDTAECYLDSEELIGNAVSHRRDDYYLFSKCGHPGGPDGKDDWSFDGILKSIERSLKRLQTDHLDLIQLHSCSETELRKGECIRALQTARDRGYSRFIGYSGDSTAALYAIQTNAFDALQTSISIADQEAIDLTLPLAREKNMGVIAKRPIANAAWRTGKLPESTYHHAYWDRLQKLQYPFLKEDLNKAIETAMRFTASQPGVHTMIVGTKRPGRWKQNAEMLAAGPLPPDRMEEIRGRWRQAAEADWAGQV